MHRHWLPARTLEAAPARRRVEDPADDEEERNRYGDLPEGVGGGNADDAESAEGREERQHKRYLAGADHDLDVEVVRGVTEDAREMCTKRKRHGEREHTDHGNRSAPSGCRGLWRQSVGRRSPTPHSMGTPMMKTTVTEGTKALRRRSVSFWMRLNDGNRTRENVVPRYSIGHADQREGRACTCRPRRR